MTEENESETEIALFNQQISRLLTYYYYQHDYHPEINDYLSLSELQSDISILEQTLKFPEILFVGALFKDLIHLLDEKNDLLVLHPQTFKRYNYLATLIQTKIPVIILPDAIDFRRRNEALQEKKYLEEESRIFYHVLRKADKYKLPKDLYEKLGKDIRIFNTITAYFRKKFD